MKPYLKKNAMLNKSNKSLNKQDDLNNNSNSNSNSNKINKKELETLDKCKLNKNITCNNFRTSKDKRKKDNINGFNNLEEKDNYKNMIIRLQKENEALKEENQKIKKNNYKSLNKDFSPIKEHKKY